MFIGQMISTESGKKGIIVSEFRRSDYATPIDFIQVPYNTQRIAEEKYPGIVFIGDFKVVPKEFRFWSKEFIPIF